MTGPLTPLEFDARLDILRDEAILYVRETWLEEPARRRAVRNVLSRAFLDGSAWGREHYLRWGAVLGATASVVAYTVAQVVVAVLR